MLIIYIFNKVIKYIILNIILKKYKNKYKTNFLFKIMIFLKF